MSISSSRARIHIRLAAAMAVAGLFALVLAAALIFDLLGLSERSEWHSVGLVSEIQIYQPQLRTIEDHEFYLVWVDSTPVALSTLDPHRGVCHIRWFERDSFFADPCGGSVYARDGTYQRGPSPRSMDQFALRVVAERVQVNIQRITFGQRHP